MNTNLQAIKGLVKLKQIVIFYSTLKVLLIILSSALECTKNHTLRPLAQKGCAPQLTNFTYHLSF